MKAADVTGVVLAGGQSRRLGLDKASLMIGGQPMLSGVVGRLRQVVSQVVVVARTQPSVAVPGTRTVTDDFPGQEGALVGIYSGLQAAKTPYAFVVACDMPLIRPELIRWMIDSCLDCDAFVPRVGAFIEPLFALYSRRCLRPIRKRLEAGDLRVRGFFEDVDTLFAEESSLRAVDPRLESLFNINTAEDLEYVMRMM